MNTFYTFPSKVNEEGQRVWEYAPDEWYTDHQMNILMADEDRRRLSSYRKREESRAKCHGTSRFLGRYPEHGTFDEVGPPCLIP